MALRPRGTRIGQLKNERVTASDSVSIVHAKCWRRHILQMTAMAMDSTKTIQMARACSRCNWLHSTKTIEPNE